MLSEEYAIYQNCSNNDFEQSVCSVLTLLGKEKNRISKSYAILYL